MHIFTYSDFLIWKFHFATKEKSSCQLDGWGETRVISIQGCFGKQGKWEMNLRCWWQLILAALLLRQIDQQHSHRERPSIFSLALHNSVVGISINHKKQQDVFLWSVLHSFHPSLLLPISSLSLSLSVSLWAAAYYIFLHLLQGSLVFFPSLFPSAPLCFSVTRGVCLCRKVFGKWEAGNRINVRPYKSRCASVYVRVIDVKHRWSDRRDRCHWLLRKLEQALRLVYLFFFFHSRFQFNVILSHLHIF